jgi:His-Xaa-Ser system radical SAM maturase HxsC
VRLHGRISASADGSPFVARLTRNRELPRAARGREALLLDSGEPFASAPPGFAAAIAVGRDAAAEGEQRMPDTPMAVGIPSELSYLGPGDVVRIDPTRQIHVLYRRQSPFNSLLVTERCNSNCVMCSQPPRAAADGYLVDELLTAIPLMSPETNEIGITGGEPTLLHEGLLRIIGCARDCLPATALHVLSNGRLFAYSQYAARIAALRHPDLVFGIPLYSDLPSRHDFVVQARGAFDQTIRGMMNLARHDVQVELRVVIHRQTYERLPQLGAFIARNLPFVSHVALMGLEMMGYVRMNLDALWTDPVDYQPQLRQCVETLAERGMRVSIYNHQLCVLDRALWAFARQSISDWKNIYMPECDGCAVRTQCGGFFASAGMRYSAHIRPVARSLSADDPAHDPAK